jgi:two-component system OmpR family response regulator
MPPYASATAEPGQDEPAEPDSSRAAHTDPHSSALGRIRTTARSIEDRVRRALTPPGSVVATLRFLVVDDHPDAADALAAVLELIGCPVRTCYDGWSALKAADEFDPQVCLLDLKMPGMDGLELAARLKARAAGRPMLLVATTALGDEATRRRTTVSGFHCHLTKPVDVSSMVEEVSRLWEALGKDPPAPPPPG